METLHFEPFETLPEQELFARYRRLQDEAPVYRAPSGYVVVTRYADVKEVLDQPQVFSSEIMQEEVGGLPTELDPTMTPEETQRLLSAATGIPLDIAELVQSRMIVSADPPKHTRLRKVVVRAFTPKRIEALAPTITHLVDELLAGVDGSAPVELVRTLTEALPVAVIADLLSVPASDRTKISDWSERIAAATHGPLRGTPAMQVQMVEALRDFSGYFVPMIEARREHPTGDLISALVRAEELDDTMTAVESLLFILVLMFAGNETTTAALGSTVVALLRDRAQLDLLSADPALIPAAVEESMRLRAPFQFMFRGATRDAEVGGLPVCKGETLVVMYGAANRDPRAFTDPDRFQISRVTEHAARHIAFGHGIHFCIGAHLARLESQLALARLLPLLPRYRLREATLARSESLLTFSYSTLDLDPV